MIEEDRPARTCLDHLSGDEFMCCFDITRELHVNISNN